ncbi:hypothetical protein G6O67_004142 [Ophiocordyceps sinensis]|uniref:Uncharacterized protein n=1 Tax=Ophiocordyceps sinensis TaxID=72228 RepID=A0A8H4PMK5_9HYPO|nr:hypothetical protein G6O67_004142 [Ophiocordyceps sinensis]
MQQALGSAQVAARPLQMLERRRHALGHAARNRYRRQRARQPRQRPQRRRRPQQQVRRPDPRQRRQPQRQRPRLRHPQQRQQLPAKRQHRLLERLERHVRRRRGQRQEIHGAPLRNRPRLRRRRLVRPESNRLAADKDDKVDCRRPANRRGQRPLGRVDKRRQVLQAQHLRLHPGRRVQLHLRVHGEVVNGAQHVQHGLHVLVNGRLDVPRVGHRAVGEEGKGEVVGGRVAERLCGALRQRVRHLGARRLRANGRRHGRGGEEERDDGLLLGKGGPQLIGQKGGQGRRARIGGWDRVRGIGDVEHGGLGVERRRAPLAGRQADGKGRLFFPVRRRVFGGQLQAQVMDGKVVEVVESVLGQADEVLGILVGKRGGVDGYLEGKDGAAGL